MKTCNTPANLKGMAKHTYNRVMSAMAEDSDPAMLHTFAALTDGAKAIALQSGNFSNLYIRGINKGMTAEEAANELTERAAALASRKLRKIDMICAAAFLAEYISRQRKEAEQPEPTNPDNTLTAMNANEIDAPESSELSHAETIARRIEAMKPRGAWNNGVKQYALMLLDWYETEASESPLTLETMLNGAKDWQQYARGGAGVAQCYNARIAETLCSPSELKRNNHGAKMPNRFEDWQDIEARALFQAWRLITEAETLVNCNA